MIEIFVADNNRWPLAYSDHYEPRDKPSQEPVLNVGDVVTTSGPWVEPQTAAVLEVSADHRTAWIAVPGPGGDRTAIGIHRVQRVVRGASEWVR